MLSKNKSSRKINIITLGCSKNTVDSEQLMRQLSAHGLQVEHDATHSDAKTVIINTCGFIKDAKQESIDTILQYALLKEQGKIDNLFVMGCLAERYKDDLKESIKEVDKYFGVNDLNKIIETIGYNFQSNLIGERLLSTPSHYAYLKIAEGCNRKCAFCAIPAIRGAYRSKTIDDLVYEAEKLAEQGVKELIVISQDSSYYGKDLKNGDDLVKLIDRLSSLPYFNWIRIHYTYPTQFPFEILDLMKERSNICRYLDIPFQHINNNVLDMMRRGHGREEIERIINEARSKVSDIAIRTTFIVGHPGEGQREFDELYTFVKNTRFDRLGVFTYSHEEDTYGFLNYKDSLTDKVKNVRMSKIMSLQQSISASLNEQKIGKNFRVLVDRLDGEFFVARTQFDSPEIDNEVLLLAKGNNYQIGHFYDVTIKGAEDFDLFA